MTVCFGIDVSNNNPGMNFAQVKAEGFEFAWLKVSEGDYFTDTTWPAYRDAAKAAGLLVAGYQYLRGDCDINRQADLFVRLLGDEPAMIDFEQNSGGIDVFWAFVNACNARGKEISLSYIPHWYWQQIGSPDLSQVPGLISSAYTVGADYASNLYANAGGDNGSGWAPYGGATPAVWQFTDRAMVAGKAVDANAFRGTRDQLAQILGAVPPAPAGPPPFQYPSTDRMVLECWEQLRGVHAQGWPQLANLPLVDAIATIGQHLNIPGFIPPAK